MLFVYDYIMIGICFIICFMHFTNQLASNKRMLDGLELTPTLYWLKWFLADKWFLAPPNGLAW